MKKITLLLCVFSAVSSVYAGTGNGNVQIQHVGQWSGKDLMFFYTTNQVSSPSCNTANRWVLDLSTTLGRSQYSLLLSAQSLQKEVVIRGSGVCDLWSNSESVHWVGFPID